MGKAVISLVLIAFAVSATEAWKCTQTSRYDNDCGEKIETRRTGIGMCYQKKHRRECCKMCEEWKQELKEYENLPAGCDYGDRNQYWCEGKPRDCSDPEVKAKCCRTCNG